MGPDRQAAVEAVGRALQRYQRSVQAFDDAVGRLLDLSPADLRALDRLSESSCSAGELAVAAGLRPAATTALLDRLEARGWVLRSPSPLDRRRTVIELSDQGRARVMEFYGPLAADGPRLLAGFDEAQLAAMARLLGEMAAATDARRPG